jgi:hypothetical protein
MRGFDFNRLFYEAAVATAVPNLPPEIYPQMAQMNADGEIDGFK